MFSCLLSNYIFLDIVEYRVKSPKFLLHVFQYYYLNIEILKSYENLEFFWILKFLNIFEVFTFFENFELAFLLL
jgi:hypothetical protein